jgi:hypothetical protein
MPPPEDFPFFIPSSEHGIRNKFQDPTALSSPVIGTTIQHGVQHWNVGRVELRPLKKEVSSERVNKVIRIENSTQGVSEE